MAAAVNLGGIWCAQARWGVLVKDREEDRGG